MYVPTPACATELASVWSERCKDSETRALTERFWVNNANRWKLWEISNSTLHSTI